MLKPIKQSLFMGHEPLEKTGYTWKSKNGVKVAAESVQIRFRYVCFVANVAVGSSSSVT
jgi:hypothetical protein